MTNPDTQDPKEARKRALQRPRNRAGRFQRTTGASADRKRYMPQIAEGSPGNLGSDSTRARRRLNLSTLEAMQRAFDKGGQRAIDRVMRQSPAIFLKMLVLLVPRELEVSHSGSIKAMTDQQIEDAIAAIRRMMDGKMIDVTPTTSGSETPETEPDDANPLK